jgi:uncharacterized protein YvpB
MRFVGAALALLQLAAMLPSLPVLSTAEEETPQTVLTEEVQNLTQEFVERLYTIVLGRSADSAGLENWTSLLESGSKTAAEVIVGFVYSQEYLSRQTSDSEYVTMLYQTLLNRTPAETEISAWCEKAALFSRRYLLRGFVCSSEFSALCEEYGVVRGSITLTENRDKNAGLTSFIGTLYEQSLGRKPDTAGLNNWTGYVLSGERTLTEVMLDFIASDEFKQKNPENSDYVTSLYRCILGRNPDAAGLAGWTETMDCGKSRFSVFLGFVKSTEFKNLCEGYGISGYLSDISHVASFVKANSKTLVYRSASRTGGNLGYVYSGQILTVTGLRGEYLKVDFQGASGYIPISAVTSYESSSIKILPVMNIPQCSTIGGRALPTGCEVTSLSVLMRYLGFTDATKNLLAERYMPCGSIGSTDPNYAFIGDPSSSHSYGAYAGVMVKTAKNYFSANGVTDYNVTNLTGTSLASLYEQIDAGNPVLVWYTMNCTSARRYGTTWWLSRGTSYTASGSGSYSFTWKNSEHCSVLVGYNKARGTVILADVWANSGASTGALTEYSASAFESAYIWLGSQAVIITK